MGFRSGTIQSSISAGTLTIITIILFALSLTGILKARQLADAEESCKSPFPH